MKPVPDQNVELAPLVLCLMTSNGVEMTELVARMIEHEKGSGPRMAAIEVDDPLQDVERHAP